MHGRHLTMDEREMMAQRRAEGQTQAEIARRLGCHRATISREVRRNAEPNGDYRPSRAQARADRLIEVRGAAGTHLHLDPGADDDPPKREPPTDVETTP